MIRGGDVIISLPTKAPYPTTFSPPAYGERGRGCGVLCFLGVTAEKLGFIGVTPSARMSCVARRRLPQADSVATQIRVQGHLAFGGSIEVEM